MRIFIFSQYIKYLIENMLKIINHVTSTSKIWKEFTSILSNLNNFHSLEFCGSRRRDTTSSGWKFKLNNLAVKGLMQITLATAEVFEFYFRPFIMEINSMGILPEGTGNLNNKSLVFHLRPIEEWFSLSHDDIGRSSPSFSCYFN